LSGEVGKPASGLLGFAGENTKFHKKQTPAGFTHGCCFPSPVSISI